MQNKSGIFWGFLIGLICSFLGTMVYLSIFSPYSISEAIPIMHQNKTLGMAFAIGAITMFVPFYFFNYKKMDYHMRGIILAVFAIAITTLIYKIV